MIHESELTDTHCHLVSEKLLAHAEELVARAAENQVTRIINIAYNGQTTVSGFDLAKKFPQVWTTFGIQPHDASEYSFERAENLCRLAQDQEKVVAVGEIGLDAHYTLSPMPQQEKCFDHFLSIAARLEKPVVVHVRETHEKVVSALKNAKKTNDVRGVIHCFTGSKSEAKEFLDLGMYISFSGIITFKSAHTLAEVAKYVPLEKILIETDSPYLAPVPNRGKTNEPAFLKHTAAFLAQLKGVAYETLAKTTNHNATSLFRL